MNHAPLATLALSLALGAALPATAFGQDQGKIDDVEQSAKNAAGNGGHHGGGHDHGDDDDHGGGGPLFWILRVIFAPGRHGVTPADSAVSEPPGQGYLAYPYQGPLDQQTFVLPSVTERRTFGAFSGAYFIDDQSTLRSAQFSLEGAYDRAYLSFEYDYFREPRPDGTDYLHLGRLGVAYLPPLGDAGYAKVGIALQAVGIGHGPMAGGPGLDLGVQLFPARPIGLSASARVAALTWEHGPLFGTGFADLAANGSVFIGRVELMGGYRWTRIGVGWPFRGPTVGMRVWF